MMKIEEVESLFIGSGYYLRIHTDTGLTGLGQSAFWGYPEAVGAIVNTFREYLIGKSPFQIEHHWQALYRMRPFRGGAISGAVSAVDIALWDIKGKHLGVPIWELMGGKCRDRIRLHLFIMGALTVDDIFDAAKAAAAEGFTAIKFDPLLPGYQDMSLDKLIKSVVEVVGAAREAVGPDVDLILEMHRKLTPMNAIPVAEAVVPFNPLFYEDPVQIDSIISQGEIARRIRLPLANGERLHSIWEFRELLAHGGSQYVRPDVGAAGGLTHCKKIAAIAESYHSALVSHNFLGPVLTAASVHLDTCIPNFLVQEYSKIDESVEMAVFTTAVKRRGGYIPVPEVPGLGVEIDESFLAKRPYTPRDASRILLRTDGSVAFSN